MPVGVNYFRDNIDQKVAGNVDAVPNQEQTDRFKNPEQREKQYFSPQLEEAFEPVQPKKRARGDIVRSLGGDLAMAQQDLGELLRSEDIEVRERAKELTGFAEDIRQKLLKFNDIVNINVPDSVSPTQTGEEIFSSLSEPKEEERVGFNTAIENMNTRVNDALSVAPEAVQRFPTLAETQNRMLSELSRLNELKNARAGLRKDILAVGKGRISRGVLNAMVSVKSAEITSEINSIVGELDVSQRMYEQQLRLIQSQRDYELQRERFAREDEERAFERERFALDREKFGLSQRKQSFAEQKFAQDSAGEEEKGLPEELTAQHGVLAKAALNQLDEDELKRLESYLKNQVEDVFEGRESIGDFRFGFGRPDAAINEGIDLLIEAYNNPAYRAKKQQIGTIVLTLLNIGR